jgi:hypothetical protein
MTLLIISSAGAVMEPDSGVAIAACDTCGKQYVVHNAGACIVVIVIVVL